MRVGQLVEVHTKYNDTWSSGFEVAGVVPGGYRLMRTSDRSMLPNVTGETDVRPCDARRR